MWHFAILDSNSIRPLSVPFLLRTSGFSQSSWLNLEPMEAALSIPFLYNVQATMYIVQCTYRGGRSHPETSYNKFRCFFLCGYYAKKSVTTQNWNIPAKKGQFGLVQPLQHCEWLINVCILGLCGWCLVTMCILAKRLKRLLEKRWRLHAFLVFFRTGASTLQQL